MFPCFLMLRIYPGAFAKSVVDLLPDFKSTSTNVDLEEPFRISCLFFFPP